MNAPNRCPTAPVSWGELLDKIAILEIKQQRLHNARARANVARELTLLAHIAAEVMRDSTVHSLTRDLRQVNEALWEIEDALRLHEAAGDFGAGFVQLARSVYQQNDRRAALKRKIDEQLGSVLVEEKSYGAAVQRGDKAIGRSSP